MAQIKFLCDVSDKSVRSNKSDIQRLSETAKYGKMIEKDDIAALCKKLLSEPHLSPETSMKWAGWEQLLCYVPLYLH